MIVGICQYCKNEFRKREQKRKFCSLKCASQFNKNGLKKIQLPDYSPELAEFVGICLGDGCAWGYQVSITLHSEWDKLYILFVVDLAKELFPGIVVSLIKKKNEKAIDIRLSSKLMADYLKSMGVISHNKQVVDWVLTDPSYIKSCIRGLIDTDGSFILHRYKIKGKEYFYPKLSFTNKSEALLNFVFKELNQLGFNPKKSYKYQVWLHSQKDVKNYLELIGTSNKKTNIGRIKDLHSNLANRSKDQALIKGY